jgi:membrane protein implicated in regulation of membrane protease activity
VIRLALAAGMLSTWLALLLLGWSFHGAVYLLLAAALAVFPWRLLRAASAGDGDAADDDDAERRRP